MTLHINFSCANIEIILNQHQHLSREVSTDNISSYFQSVDYLLSVSSWERELGLGDGSLSFLINIGDSSRWRRVVSGRNVLIECSIIITIPTTDSGDTRCGAGTRQAIIFSKVNFPEITWFHSTWEHSLAPFIVSRNGIWRTGNLPPCTEYRAALNWII